MVYRVEASSTCRRVNHPKYDDFRLVTTVQFDRQNSPTVPLFTVPQIFSIPPLSNGVLRGLHNNPKNVMIFYLFNFNIEITTYRTTGFIDDAPFLFFESGATCMGISKLLFA